MLIAIIRGGGDLASGIALRLHHSGIKVIITEKEQPLAVRRYVSFAEAVYTRSISIEDIEGKLVQNENEINQCHTKDKIPVIIDENAEILARIKTDVYIDARMLKKRIQSKIPNNLFQIGIGPGFFPNENCDCVIETKRGPYLGRVYWKGTVEEDNGIPEKVGEYQSERVLRSPCLGILKAKCEIGDIVDAGDVIASVNGLNVYAPFNGVIRGLLHEGIKVFPNMKIGDVDPRCDPLLCTLVSDKALAIGGGVLEAILSIPENRKILGE